VPYTTANPPRPAKNWSTPAKALCARVANGVLKGGGSDQQAVYACIRAVKSRYPSTIKAPRSSWRKAEEQAAIDSFFEGKTAEDLEQIFAPLLPRQHCQIARMPSFINPKGEEPKYGHSLIILLLVVLIYLIFVTHLLAGIK